MTINSLNEKGHNIYTNWSIYWDPNAPAKSIPNVPDPLVQGN